MYHPYPGDGEYCNAEWPYGYPYDALAEYYWGKELLGVCRNSACLEPSAISNEADEVEQGVIWQIAKSPLGKSCPRNNESN